MKIQEREQPKVYCENCKFIDTWNYEGPRCMHPNALHTEEYWDRVVYRRDPPEQRNARNNCPDYRRRFLGKIGEHYSQGLELLARIVGVFTCLYFLMQFLGYLMNWGQ